MLLLVLKKSVGLALLLLITGSPAPESEQYRKAILANKELKPVEQLKQYKGYNFAPLWLKTEERYVVGFIGNNYQRLRLKLLTARPDLQQSGRYLVTGKSKVRNTVLPFEGTITLRHVRLMAKVPGYLDDMPSPASKVGVVLAEYELHEAQALPGAGVFRGVLLTKWYLDRSGKLCYDDLEKYADSFHNNQFVGTWQSYTSGAVKRCNWGDWRVPSGTPATQDGLTDNRLDMGAGEFSPATEYLSNGWQSYWAEAKAAKATKWWQ